MQNAIVKKYQEVEKYTESLLEVVQDWQTIQRHLKNRLEKIKLTKKQQEKLDRYQFAWSMLVSGDADDGQVAEMICQTYHVEKSQAYEDIKCTREVFGSVVSIKKQLGLQTQYQIMLKAQSRALALDNMTSFASISKVIHGILKDIEDEEENPASEFHGHVFEPVFDPALLNSGEEVNMKEVLDAINAKRKVKLKMNEIATAIPYEEIDPL